MGFSSLLGNKMVQKLFMKQFTDIVKKEGAKHIVINVIGETEFEPIIYTQEIVVQTKKQYDELLKQIENFL